MTFKDWLATQRFASSKARHGATAGVVVLATGGLFLLRAHAAAGQPMVDAIETSTVGVTGPTPPVKSFSSPPPVAASTGPTTVSFAGPRVHGTFALSNAVASTEPGGSLYADISLTAEARGEEHAPLALAVVLDTSGSMEGEKLREAKEAVKGLVRSMHDDDEIAFVRYSSAAQVVQPLARVGQIRPQLAASIDGLVANGGTAIPLGLAAGVHALSSPEGDKESNRVRRVVLVSDGLDASRPESERIAATSTGRGITVSSMGIGLDFNESYMGGIARSGHGNFGFVNDRVTLAAFLDRELRETATTTAQSTVVHLHLPDGVRFVRATGASAEAHGRDVDLQVGALYASEDKRVLVQMTTDLEVGAVADFNGSLTWLAVGGSGAEATIPQIEVVASSDAERVRAGRNESVQARAASVEASERQLEAAQAYADGDTGRATALIQQNLAVLHKAARSAPAPMAAMLSNQSSGYDRTMDTFRHTAPASALGRSAAKTAAASNAANASASTF
jgi:Ca-activated chloride channel family protein